MSQEEVYELLKKNKGQWFDYHRIHEELGHLQLPTLCVNIKRLCKCGNENIEYKKVLLSDSTLWKKRIIRYVDNNDDEEE